MSKKHISFRNINEQEDCFNCTKYESQNKFYIHVDDTVKKQIPSREIVEPGVKSNDFLLLIVLTMLFLNKQL